MKLKEIKKYVNSFLFHLRMKRMNKQNFGHERTLFAGYPLYRLREDATWEGRMLASETDIGNGTDVR